MINYYSLSAFNQETNYNRFVRNAVYMEAITMALGYISIQWNNNESENFPLKIIAVNTPVTLLLKASEYRQMRQKMIQMREWAWMRDVEVILGCL